MPAEAKQGARLPIDDASYFMLTLGYLALWPRLKGDPSPGKRGSEFFDKHLKRLGQGQGEINTDTHGSSVVLHLPFPPLQSILRPTE